MEKRKILIGQKIREIRKRFNLTQEKFCEIICLEPSSLSYIETGKNFPSMQTINKIMDEFHIEPQEFFDYSYIKSDEELTKEIIDIVSRQPHSNKQIIYSIVKLFC